MTKEQTKSSTKEIKILLNGVKDALLSLKSLIIALVAIAITISEELIKAFSELLSNSQNSPKEITILNQVNKFSEMNSPKKNIEPKVEEITKEKITKEERGISLSNRIIYPTLATISTIALLGGVIKLGNISKWAKTQVDCVESVSKVYGVSEENLINKVMICNGGHN